MTAHPHPEHPQVCPYIGVEEDLQTCLAYPSHWNLCHHCTPVSMIRLGHQRQVCLTPAHADCPVFQTADVLPLPHELRGRRSQVPKAVPGRL